MNKPLKRTPLKRKTPFPHSTKPIRSVNPEATAKRKKRYAKALRSIESKAARREAACRAHGICECGCNMPFTMADPRCFHHLRYTRLGHELPEDFMALRKSCHERIEMRDFGYRHTRGRRAA